MCLAMAYMSGCATTTYYHRSQMELDKQDSANFKLRYQGHQRFDRETTVAYFESPDLDIIISIKNDFKIHKNKFNYAYLDGKYQKIEDRNQILYILLKNKKGNLKIKTNEIYLLHKDSTHRLKSMSGPLSSKLSIPSGCTAVSNKSKDSTYSYLSFNCIYSPGNNVAFAIPSESSKTDKNYTNSVRHRDSIDMYKVKIIRNGDEIENTGNGFYNEKLSDICKDRFNAHLDTFETKQQSNLCYQLKFSIPPINPKDTFDVVFRGFEIDGKTLVPLKIRFTYKEDYEIRWFDIHF
jgi:prepilin-type processing-associated H-X9-DG protein